MLSREPLEGIQLSFVCAESNRLPLSEQAFKTAWLALV
jgi:hypothetical protein